MATHFSILAWRIPQTGNPDSLQSMGWQSQSRLSDDGDHHYYYPALMICQGLFHVPGDSRVIKILPLLSSCQTDLGLYFSLVCLF